MPKRYFPNKPGVRKLLNNHPQVESYHYEWDYSTMGGDDRDFEKIFVYLKNGFVTNFDTTMFMATTITEIRQDLECVITGRHEDL